MFKSLIILEKSALKMVYIFVVPFFLGACNQSLVTSGSKHLPPIRAGKARVIHILDNHPSMWNVAPFYISIDGHSRARASVNKVSVIHVEPGQRLISYHREKVMGSKDGVSLYFLKGQTRYLYCKAARLSEDQSFGINQYKVSFTELDSFNASERLKENEAL